MVHLHSEEHRTMVRSLDWAMGLPLITKRMVYIDGRQDKGRRAISCMEGRAEWFIDRKRGDGP